MKPFVQIAFPTGHVFEIPTAVIANDRAKSMQQRHPDEFPNLEAALEDTTELFKDSSYDVQDWARNNMNWSELEPQARLIRYAPAALDHINGCEWSLHDARAMVGELDGETIMRQPVEMVLNVMVLSQQLCNVTVLNGPDGKPYAAMALIIGTEPVIGTYLQAMQIVGNSLTGGQPAALN